LSLHSYGIAAARNAILAAEPELLASLDSAASLLTAQYLASAGPVVEQLTNDYRAEMARLDASLRQVLTILPDARRRQFEFSEHRLGGQ